VAILPAERDAAALQYLGHEHEKRRRRTYQELAAKPARLGPLRQLRSEGEPIGAQPVHLPVAGD
jgi:hypothetical protein